MNTPTSYVGVALLLTAIAGLSTGLGGLFILRRKATNYRFLTASLGFSAGVMIYVSFVEIMQESVTNLTQVYGDTKGGWFSVAAFFGGIAFIAIIDALIPEDTNPHEVQSPDALDQAKTDLEKQAHGERVTHVAPTATHAPRRTRAASRGGDTRTPTATSAPAATAASAASVSTAPKATDTTPRAQKDPQLMRTGIVSALAIAIHNFPEGLATFMAALVDPALGLSIAVAIAIHNISEGISVAVPIYFATGNKKKAFIYTFLSGLAEPIGGLVGYLVLRPFLSTQLMGVVFGVVAGIMVYISLDELLPASEKYGEHHVSMIGLIAGMAVMAISLLLLG